MKKRTFIMVFVFVFMLCAQLQSAIADTRHIFNVRLVGAQLMIQPAYNSEEPNKYYTDAGIKVLTPGFSVRHCTPSENHFCKFGVSTNAPASLALSGPSGMATVTVCLNANNKTLSCENHQISIPPIIFITSTQFNGNLGEVAGADERCNEQAYLAGSIIPPGRTFKALLLSPARSPCSNPNQDSFGGCGGSFAKDWPLVPGRVYYQPNAIDSFNTVNANGVFNGQVVALQDSTGQLSNDQFWSGIQSVHSDPSGFDIDAWAYDDMNPNQDNQSYIANHAYCQNWSTSQNTAQGSVGSAGRYQGSMLGPVPQNTWGNYYYFLDGSISYLFNLFDISAYYPCDGLASLVCVG